MKEVFIKFGKENGKNFIGDNYRKFHVTSDSELINLINYAEKYYKFNDCSYVEVRVDDKPVFYATPDIMPY
ncbi:hypothetical protein [Clostridium sp.]|uniref:hypothetical protein n=1 Tax=Clostridium sp. TaxID=1506 RepID=UPI001B4DD8CB|nr:hypothetical protein [Clostridium sp.]MBP3916614.1 hypothetical protein [Clostridium sp.]